MTEYFITLGITVDEENYSVQGDEFEIIQRDVHELVGRINEGMRGVNVELL